jgi:ABC-2 type transport system ATP-binding protein
MIQVAVDPATTKRELMQEKRVHTSDNTVIVNGIGKSFGAVDALRDVSLEVGRGEVVALLGPNGAGKTTMVDILSTLTRPDRGHASIAGFDVVSQAASVRRSIMLTGQQVALDEILTGRENLVLFGRLQGLSKSNARSRAEELLREFDLVHAADRRVGTYSGGMRRRIDIACGLVVRPEVVFLDEPTTGLDPRSRQTIWDLVAGFKNLGIATLLTTQYLEEADALSDRIIVIDHGVIVAEGTADQLKERTGGSYCEIVPRDLNDLPAIADALGSLLPEENRAALTNTADRIAIPAPGGANTLVEALSRLNTANIELTDIALRRPSLDDVFLSLTKDSASIPVPDEPVAGEQPVDVPVVTPNGSDGAKHRTSGRGRSWLASHSRASIMLVTWVVTCVNLLIAASLVIPQKDSRPGDRSAANTSVSPASIRAGPPPGSAPSTPQLSLPSEPLPTPVPLVAPSATPSATTLQQQEFADVHPANPPLQAAVSAPEVPIASPPVAPVSTPQVPIASPPVAPVSTPQVPIASPPVAPVSTPQEPIASPPVAPPDPLQVILSPLLGALP